VTWIYRQSTGDLAHVTADTAGRIDTFGGLPGAGYSGHGEGLNNPAMQHVRSVGPIPRGRWTIGAPYDSDTVGAFALPLLPDPDTETFGRSAFVIHGDNYHQDRSASRGCIVLPRKVREAIHESDDSELEVVA
jgi:type VI secretion system (T6SS) effector TldE1-like protein